MTESDTQPDRLEELIAEVQRLDQAGVFNRTPVDPAALACGVADTRRPRLLRRLFVGLQAAACIALTVGVISLWRGGDGPLGPADGGPGNDNSAMASCTDVRALARCFTGPVGQPLDDDCQCVDFDADGDVDLADFGAFQVAFASSR